MLNIEKGMPLWIQFHVMVEESRLKWVCIFEGFQCINLDESNNGYTLQIWNENCEEIREEFEERCHMPKTLKVLKLIAEVLRHSRFGNWLDWRILWCLRLNSEEFDPSKIPLEKCFSSNENSPSPFIFLSGRDIASAWAKIENFLDCLSFFGKIGKRFSNKERPQSLRTKEFSALWVYLNPKYVVT